MLAALGGDLIILPNLLMIFDRRTVYRKGSGQTDG